MDWKPYYRSELVTPGVREVLIGYLEEGRDPLIEEGLKRGAIVSFPHTSVHYSGTLQARLVSSLYRWGISRIIGLGVLHGIGIPAFRRARDGDLSADERKGAFEEIKGGFVPEGDRFETPFGGYPTWIPEAWNGSIRIDRFGLLSSEFSLDTFVSILRLGADLFKRRPIPILPLFIGMTREPVSRDFSVASKLASFLRRIVGPDVAVVTTGDLVHYGTAYASPGEEVGEDGPLLEERFKGMVIRMLEAGLVRGDDEEAYRISTDGLKSDQREILPVIAAYLKRRGSYRILHFELSDYAGILSVDRPCRVGSALLIYG